MDTKGLVRALGEESLLRHVSSQPRSPSLWPSNHPTHGRAAPLRTPTNGASGGAGPGGMCGVADDYLRNYSRLTFLSFQESFTFR